MKTALKVIDSLNKILRKIAFKIKDCVGLNLKISFKFLPQYQYVFIIKHMIVRKFYMRKIILNKSKTRCSWIYCNTNL